ncbi:MAG: hypothetical protein HKN00_03995 [Flavobacteriaceae bacterium]|nr:hypothetical protein [Bacteroidia bacterium]NNF74322.1 hypothetical protein [Flavobacteriaceae bacterium]NNK72085.1 hypothetical protein [Flavobacteriaceae bacterium]
MKKITCLYSLILLFVMQSVSFAQEIKRVRLNFHSPTNLNRELLLGFTPNNEATDGFDYGYDGASPDSFPDDMHWIINDQYFVIQGVGSFERSKTYPLWINLTNPGISSISLISLENFEEPVDVFIYDNVADTYTNINTSSLDLNLPPNEYQDRFYIAFQIPEGSGSTLGLDESEQDLLNISYDRRSKRLFLSTGYNDHVNAITIYNTIGQTLLADRFHNQQEISITLPFNKSQVILVAIDTDKGRVIKRILI